MKAQWKTLLVKTTAWLAAEIILNLVGLDSIADYSEFVFEHEVAVLSQHSHPTAQIIF